MEPEKTVISRSNDECVVALCDQWYMLYMLIVYKDFISGKILLNFGEISKMMLHVKNVHVILGFHIETLLSQVLGIWRREMETVGYQGFESSGDVL